MRRSLRPALWLAILTVALGITLAACSSGAGTDTSPPSLSITSSATASGVTYHLTGSTSDNVGATKITYAVNGGATKTVDLSGATFDVSITLSPGVNTIDVTVYDAAGNETTKTLKVTYTPPPTTGSLTIDISGVPGGAPADVTVSGPTAVAPVTATFTVTGLTPGTYTVTPKDVTAQDVLGNTYTYAGAVTVNGQAVDTVDVTAGTTETAKVAYAASTGDLKIHFQNVPTGVSGSLDLSGATAIPTVTQDTVLTGLTPDTYQLTANQIQNSTYTYAGSPSVNNALVDHVVVPAGVTETVLVDYEPSSGAMTIAFSGSIPSGASYGATVDGADLSNATVSRHVTTSTAGSVTVPYLTYGNYTLTPDSMPSSACVGGSKTVYGATVAPSPPPLINVGATVSESVAYFAVTMKCLP